MPVLVNTPIDSIEFNGNRVFVKRDDQLHKEFSGNKARKFAYFLNNEFPGVSRLVGYDGLDTRVTIHGVWLSWRWTD